VNAYYINAIDLGESLEYVGEEAFMYCCEMWPSGTAEEDKTLVSVDFGNTLKYVGDDAFKSWYKAKVKHLEFAEDVEYIGEYSFYGMGEEMNWRQVENPNFYEVIIPNLDVVQYKAFDWAVFCNSIKTNFDTASYNIPLSDIFSNGYHYTNTYLLDGTPYTDEVIRDNLGSSDCQRYGCFVEFEDIAHPENNLKTDVILDASWNYTTKKPVESFCINDFTEVIEKLDESLYTSNGSSTFGLARNLTPVYRFDEFQYLDSAGEWRILTDDIRSKMLSTISDEITVRDRTLHLRASYYVQEFDVTFMMNNGTSDIYETQAVQEGLAVEKPENPSLDKLAFVDWYTEPECINVYDFTQAVSEDITLYADWTNWTADVHFVSVLGNGPVIEDIADVMDGSTISRPVIENESTLYETVTFFKDAACTTEWDFANDTVSCIKDKDMVNLYYTHVYKEYDARVTTRLYSTIGGSFTDKLVATDSLRVGAEYSYVPETLEGYRSLAEEAVSGTMSADDVDIVFEYVKTYQVTVKDNLYEGTELKETIVRTIDTFDNNTAWSYMPVDYTNYVPKTNEIQYGVISGDVEVNFDYILDKYTITIKDEYLKSDGTVDKSIVREEKNLKSGSTFKFTAKEVSGYTCSSANSYEGQATSDLVIIFTYKPISESKEEKRTEDIKQAMVTVIDSFTAIYPKGVIAVNGETFVQEIAGQKLIWNVKYENDLVVMTRQQVRTEGKYNLGASYYHKAVNVPGYEVVGETEYSGKVQEDTRLVFQYVDNNVTDAFGGFDNLPSPDDTIIITWQPEPKTGDIEY